MTLFRSLLFNTLFYVNLLGRMILLSPVFFLGSEETSWRIVKAWARSSLWLLRHVAGVDSAIGGQANIPAGPCIVASKHQSFWEVFALLPELDKPTFILKQELMRIPFFGWYAAHMGMIPVDRSKRGGALPSMLENAERAVVEGRQIVIFPEGTRTSPGMEPDYRPGLHHLYLHLNLPVVPVALNSGLFWPRRSFRRYPGTIRAEFLPAIAPGLDRPTFFAALRGAIEGRSFEFLREAADRNPGLPLSELTRARLAQEAAGETAGLPA